MATKKKDENTKKTKTRKRRKPRKRRKKQKQKKNDRKLEKQRKSKKDENQRKRRRFTKKTTIKKTKADVRLFALTGDAPLAEQGLSADRQKDDDTFAVFVFLHFPK